MCGTATGAGKARREGQCKSDREPGRAPSHRETQRRAGKVPRPCRPYARSSSAAPPASSGTWPPGTEAEIHTAVSRCLLACLPVALSLSLALALARAVCGAGLPSRAHLIIVCIQRRGRVHMLAVPLQPRSVKLSVRLLQAPVQRQHTPQPRHLHGRDRQVVARSREQPRSAPTRICRYQRETETDRDSDGRDRCREGHRGAAARGRAELCARARVRARAHRAGQARDNADGEAERPRDSAHTQRESQRRERAGGIEAVCVCVCVCV